MMGETIFKNEQSEVFSRPKLKWEGEREEGRESLFVTGVGLNQRIFTMSDVNVVSTGQDMGAHWLGHRLPVDTTSYLLVAYIKRPSIQSGFDGGVGGESFRLVVTVVTAAICARPPPIPGDRAFDIDRYVNSATVQNGNESIIFHINGRSFGATSIPRRAF